AEPNDVLGPKAARVADLDRRPGRAFEEIVGGWPVGEPDRWRIGRHYPQRRHREGAPAGSFGAGQSPLLVGATPAQATRSLHVPPAAHDDARQYRASDARL